MRHETVISYCIGPSDWRTKQKTIGMWQSWWQKWEKKMARIEWREWSKAPRLTGGWFRYSDWLDDVYMATKGLVQDGWGIHLHMRLRLVRYFGDGTPYP